MPIIPVPDSVISQRALRALIQQRNILAALEVFHEELGDIFRIPLKGFNPVMLVGPEANRFLLAEGREDFRWRADGDPVTTLLRHGILVEDGEAHDELRRLMMPMLHRRALQSYVEAMWRSTDAVTARWKNDALLDMLVEMRRAALLILMQTLFSIDFEPELRSLWKPIMRALAYISPGAWVVWRGVPRPGYARALKQLDDYLYEVIRLRRVHKTVGDDLLGVLVQSGMSDHLIRDQLLTMIIAGHDTSTALLSWVLYFIATKPALQRELQHEIRAVVGDSPPEYEQLSALQSLDCVIQETLRLYPPIHLGSRIAATDLEYNGYPIPAGQRVLYSIYLTQRDARYWEHPTLFVPERFAVDSSQQRRAYTYLPFGGGPRNCIGVAFAQVEAKVVLARLLQTFDFEYSGGRVYAHMGATLEPRPGVRVKVRRRQSFSE